MKDRGARRLVYGQYYTGLPTDRAEWQDVIYQLVDHCRRRYRSA